ncbi:MAG: TIGR03960 family B12-binding radical SAM protein [Clostridia bacterium]|nr:TIGR03960 family B12-binding radical SAM protein [Clostridia bacterium]
MTKKLDSVLPLVQKPARYIGGELNSIIKNADKITSRFAFCFPDVYEVGMSHLGMKILYHQLNRREDTWVERVFTPWDDMEMQMKENNIPLYGLESRDPLKEFDFVGFTLQYELSYSNILNMLKMADIPIYSKDRGENDPLICAGGPCAYNGEPIADFIDFFLLGEGEEIWEEVLDAYALHKKNGGSKKDFLLKIAREIQGIYVPSFYDVSYNNDGTVKEISINTEGVPEKIRKRIIVDMDKVYYPDAFVVPFMDIVHNRVMLEIFRGCIRGCRFCQAGMIYRPVREKSAENLCLAGENLISSTGYEEMSLSSLSTSDYTQFEKLANGLIDMAEKKKVSLSLPSLRIDNMSLDILKKVQTVRKSGLTFAPEAGTQRLRDVLNKGVTQEDILRSANMVFCEGWSNVKLYFMMGLPTETDEDIVGIARTGYSVLDCFKKCDSPKKANRINITVSVSSFVPKPFTPFQWEAQNPMEELVRKQQLLKDTIKTRAITYNYHMSKVSCLEGVFARGDRRLSKVIELACEKGCKFDGWDEFFKYDAWMEAFCEAGLEPEFYSRRKREFSEVLPWDMVDIGVTKAFLQRECEKAYRGETTPNCREKCSGCGAKSFGGGVCYE